MEKLSLHQSSQRKIIEILLNQNSDKVEQRILQKVGTQEACKGWNPIIHH